MLANQIHVAISGGIAVGKTTLAASLSSSILDSQCFIEHPECNAYLGDFYEDMKKWAFHSRIGMLALLLERYQRLDASKRIVVMDRCVHELITFAKLHFDRGNLSAQDFHIYRSVYDGIITLAPPLDFVVYLHCSPPVALARIQARKRRFESNVTAAYLSEICNYYEPWLRALPASTKILRYDTDNGLDVEKVRLDVARAVPRVNCQEKT